MTEVPVEVVANTNEIEINMIVEEAAVVVTTVAQNTHVTVLNTRMIVRTKTEEAMRTVKTFNTLANQIKETPTPHQIGPELKTDRKTIIIQWLEMTKMTRTPRRTMALGKWNSA